MSMQARVLPALTLVLLAGCVTAAPLDDALALYRARDYSEARHQLEALDVAGPNNPEIIHALGLIALHQQRFDDAVSLLEHASALAPEDVPSLVDLSEAYGGEAQNAGLFSRLTWAQKCRVTLEKAVTLAPKSTLARAALVSFYRMAPAIAGGGHEKARAQAEELRKLDEPLGVQSLVLISVSDKNYDQAFALCDAALKQQPENYRYLFSLGRVAAQSGRRLEEGLASLKKCLAQPEPSDFPNHSVIQQRIGNIQEKLGKPDAARAAYETALTLDPENREARNALGRLASDSPASK